MSKLASLAKDTAIYGLSSIVGRFLNYLLVPLYTHVIAASSGGYGVVTNLYAYTALILVILTFGMETTFFRFANKDGENPDTVFSTTMGIVGALTAVFLLGVFGFATPLCEWLGYADHHAYVLLMAATVALDAIQAIPFSFLRYKKKALKFAALKLLFIIMNIGLNLLYFVVLGKDDVYYVFSLNLVCTALITFFFIPELLAIKWWFGFSLLRRMLSYSWPILVLGIAGILNQAFDKMIFPWAYTRTGIHTMEEAQVELGVYGACVKVAMIMAMITQAFRYAYEPIVFAKAKDKDSKEYYAVAMEMLPHLHALRLSLRHGLPEHPETHSAQRLSCRTFHHPYCHGGGDNDGNLLQSLLLVQAHRQDHLGRMVLIRRLCGACGGEHTLCSGLRLYGLRMGRLCRLCHGDGAFLHRGAEKEPYRLSYGQHIGVHSDNDSFLSCHRMEQWQSADGGRTRCEHRRYIPFCGACRAL